MSELAREIEAIVASEGPIGIDRYMALALGHPRLGYYMTGDPLGQAGDFTTAPEISQMFGELLGLWAAAVWIEMGRPDAVILAELGPGRGTLMADALRAVARVPGFLGACRVHLVETSPALRERQRAALAEYEVTWHASVQGLPAGPLLLIANEFLDALPIRQFVRGETTWHERVVGLGDTGRLAFGLAPHPEASLASAEGKPGKVLEACPAAIALVGHLSARLAAGGGAALFVDYGDLGDAFGDTLQAVRRHAFADPLAHPGEADITAHVRFAPLARIAARQGASIHGPAGQGAFLGALGIQERAAALSAGRDESTQGSIAAALARLCAPDQMGETFKAFAITHPELGAVPGLPASMPDPGDAAPTPG